LKYLNTPPAAQRLGNAEGLDCPAEMSASSESEVLAQELSAVANKVANVETRLAEIERLITGLERAAETTARAMEEISSHWDAVYRAMSRAE